MVGRSFGPDDRRGAACDDGAVAVAGVVGTICGHDGDVFVLRYLVEQVRQDGAVTFPAGGELDRANVGCLPCP
jgi:hypothetical protein